MVVALFRSLNSVVALCLLAVSSVVAAPLTRLQTTTATFQPGGNGSWESISRRSDGREYLATNQAAPILTLGVDGSLHAPTTATWDAAKRELLLEYGPVGLRARLRSASQESHLTLELVGLEPAVAVERVTLALWGPVPVTIGKTVGEVVGVVRDDEFALGIQALNPKTLGGYPDNDEGSADRPYAARATAWGSVLQAYSMDRSKPRRITVWSKRAPNMPVPAVPGETVLGSKIALFGCPEAQALATIGRIELKEGLPHPMIDGTWAKISPERGRSYLIASFSEANVDELLGHVKRAELMSLYHGDAFQSWGHFEPSSRFFPSGMAGLKACVAKARALGIRLGAHTLSNFIQTHDPYITPVPDPRLARTGESVLTALIDAEATTIPVASPEYFTNRLMNELQTLMIGQELVRYRSVSKESPWHLLDCQRGAYGTKATMHAAGSTAGKLMDHSYKVFFPNLEMQREIARNLARVFNESGLSHMDFDGHEGCLAPGEGTYGNEVFAKEFYDHLDHTVINGTSPPLSHFYWHINSYCNWGEPWYGGFRDSMQEYRINNQAFCERNFIPKMLGWYQLTPTTALSDMEWMLARAAGFDAGFALATSPDSLRKNPGTTRILDAIREWESARRRGAFSAAQRELLRNPKLEFHLQPIAGGGWDLFPFHPSSEFLHEQQVRQPGEPTHAEWKVSNPDHPQPMQFKLRVDGTGGRVVNPTFEVDRSATITFPAEIQTGQTLLVEEEGIARIYDPKGIQIRSFALSVRLPLVRSGVNHIRFDADFQGDAPPKAIVTFKTLGAPTRVNR